MNSLLTRKTESAGHGKPARKGSLTDRECRGLQPGQPALQDGRQLSLHALAGGGRVWRYRYRLNGTAGIFTIGRYPQVSLQAARDLRDLAAAQVRDGTAPILARRIEQQAQVTSNVRTVGAMTSAMIEDRAARKQGIKGAWVPEYADEVRNLVRRFILAHPIAKLPVETVEPMAIMALLEAVPDYARNPVRTILKQMFDRALAFQQMGDRKFNPVEVIRQEVTPPRSSKPHPAATIEDARAVLAAFDASTAHPITKLAHRFIALTALRIGEAAAIRWDWLFDLDGDNPTLILPAEAMKGRQRGHKVALAPQTVSVLRWARRYRRHGEDFVFFAPRHRGDSLCMRAVQIVLKQTAPIPFVPHSWRSTFSTLMNEQLDAERLDADEGLDDRANRAVDLMLAHRPRASSAAEPVYNRAEHLPRRRRIACAWADLLLDGATDLSGVCGGEMATVETPAAPVADVTPIRRAARR
jgi:integrase